ncbi:MAG: hypothetical protein J0L92_09125 [Deltaproteobacteria bacterium]|nr:hypothetical protein [Deltaproteobacteria bacterium]
MRLATLASSLGLALFVSHAHAQDADAVARLRARVAAAPSDVSLQCQLSFALVGASQHEEALTIATRAAAAIPRPLTQPGHRLLGACLYNLGRAEEGLAHRREAATAYVRSLAVRDNPAVRDRLRALVPETPEHFEAAALVMFEGTEGASIYAIQDTAAVRANGQSLMFVSAQISYAGGYTGLAAFVVAQHEDIAIVARVDEWSQEDNGARMTLAEPRTLEASAGSLRAAFEVSASGGGACGRMDGFMDFEHHATVLVSFDGAQVRSRALVTRESDCGGHSSMSLQVEDGDVIVRRARGGALRLGTYPISELLR